MQHLPPNQILRNFISTHFYNMLYGYFSLVTKLLIFQRIFLTIGEKYRIVHMRI